MPLAEDSALIEAGLDLALGPHVTVGVSYSGHLAEDATDNAGGSPNSFFPHGG